MIDNESITDRLSEKVLVTGGGGFLGSAIVKRLVKRGDRVVSFSRRFYPELAAMGVQQIQGDISDKTAVEQAFKEVNLVFHVAAKPPPWGGFSAYYRTNVIGTLNVITACKQFNVSRLVYTSSPSVIFDGTDMEGVDESVPYPEKYHAHYPKTKAMAEQSVIAAGDEGLRTIILRPHLIWGPRDNHLVPRIIERANRLVKVGDGRNLVDTIYIDNAAEAHLLADQALEANPGLTGNIYFLSQDEPIPLWDMVNQILAAGGKPPVSKSISPAAAYAIGRVCEWIFTLLGLDSDPPMTRFMARELATSHWFDISAAKKDLGYQPEVSTEEGLWRLAQWLRKPKAEGAGR